MSAHRSWRSQRLTVRGVSYYVRRWGDEDAPPLMLLHGSRDSSITYQFVVDELKHDWSIIAPDWRGHGHSAWAPQSYWLHELVADLDVLVETFSPGRAFPIVGHSLGGNVAGIYAALRPERITRLVSLDGFGPLVNKVPVDMYSLLADYLNMPRCKAHPPNYASIGEMAERLMKANRRLAADKAAFLAEHSSAESGDGQFRWLFDPGFRASLPTLHLVEEWGRIWAHMKAPVLWLSSSDTRPGASTNNPEDFAARCRLMPGLSVSTIADTGHNLHHDQPEVVAEKIETFIRVCR